MSKVSNAEALAYQACDHLDDLAKLDGKGIHHNPVKLVDLTSALTSEDSPYDNRFLDSPDSHGCVPSKDIAPILKR